MRPATAAHGSEHEQTPAMHVPLLEDAGGQRVISALCVSVVITLLMHVGHIAGAS